MAFLVLYGLGQACEVQVTNSHHLNLVTGAQVSFRVHTLFQEQISRTFPGLRLIFQGL